MSIYFFICSIDIILLTLGLHWKQQLLHAAVHLNVVKSVSVTGGWIVILLMFKILLFIPLHLGQSCWFGDVDLYIIFKTF